MKTNQSKLALVILGVSLFLLGACEPIIGQLIVNGGSGSGEYPAGLLVEISADSPVEGEEFYRWDGNYKSVVDRHLPTTKVRIEAVNTEVTATYIPVEEKYELTVVGGSGSGEYRPGTKVVVDADTPAMNSKFDSWQGDTEYLQDPSSARQEIYIGREDLYLEAIYIENPIVNAHCQEVGQGRDDGFFALKTYKNKLYAGTFGYDGHQAIYSYPAWGPVSPGFTVSESVCDFDEYNGYLYANTESDAHIYRTQNGQNWQRVFTGSSNTIGCAITHFNGHIYAVNYDNANKRNGRIYRSAGGTNWQKVYDSGNTAHYLRELVVYNNKIYAFSVNQNNNTGGFFSSADGVNWSWHPKPGIRFFRGLVWDGYLWMTSSSYASTGKAGIWRYDGTNLVEMLRVPDKSHVSDIRNLNSILFAVTTVQWKGNQGGATLMMSQDKGNSWSTACTFPETESWMLEEFQGELYLAAKQHGGRGAVYRVILN